MADELLKRIEAPQLNTAGYGNNISEQFNLIDLNFQSLANSDFFTGAQGKGLRLIKVETKSNPGLSPVFTFSENLKAHEDSILDNTAGEKLKRSIKDAFVNYIPSNTTWYADKEYTLYIEEPNNTVHNVYPIICMTEYEDVNGNKNQNNEYLDFGYEGSKLVLKPSSGFPSLYFDTTLGKFCWLINGRKSGIAAQGSDGKNGERGPGLDFDVIEAETIPADKDSFYKIKRVFWKNRMQRFYLNLSDTNKILGTDGKTVDYDEYDVEWLCGGREEWINNNKNRTFLVSRYIEEIKGEDGTTIVKPAENVIHLCKLIKKTAQRIASSNDGVNIDKELIDKELIDKDSIGNVGEDQGNRDDIVVDEGSTPPTLIRVSASPTSVNRPHASAVVKPPVFQADFDTIAKNQFVQEYKEVSASVSNIIAGGVNIIQYISASTGKIETWELSSTDKSQLATRVANYAKDIYGVYLTDENMHILSSTISAGSSSGISIAFDDMRWDQSNTSALRCMYLKDEGENSSGILLYNKTVGGPELHLRHVNDVGVFSKGNADSNRPDPDLVDGGTKGANLNIGTGVLKAGSVELSGNLKAKDVVLSGKISMWSGDNTAEIEFDDKEVKQLNISNPGGITVNGSKFTKGGAIETEGSIKAGTIETTGDLNVSKNLNISKNISIGESLSIGTTSGDGNQCQIGDSIMVKLDSGLRIDYNDTIKLRYEKDNDLDDSVKTTLSSNYGVKYYINIPNVIYEFIKDPQNEGNVKKSGTYIGNNYNLRFRNIDGDDSKYKITGYIDFYDVDGNTPETDDIGHMVIDTYFNYDKVTKTVSIPYRASRNDVDEDNSKWALPFAGVDKMNDVSKRAICLSTMSGPYMDFKSVIVGIDKSTSSVLQGIKLELPKSYTRFTPESVEGSVSNDKLFGIGGFSDVETMQYEEDLSFGGYRLNQGESKDKIVVESASPTQNTSNIPVYNKSVWITKTSYTYTPEQS